MCSTCGCSHDEVHYHNGKWHEHDHDHEHHHHHDHESDHHHDHSDTISLEKDILEKNNLLAERNRGYLEAKNILTFNLVSSPGAGKTSLLERVIKKLQAKIGDVNKIYVIEGDQQTSNDAERIEETGVKAIQINTGKGCHLDANMVNKAIKMLSPEPNSILFVENVGNLVCPALFDLGEHKRIVIFSAPEGDDKPIKYPTIFESADICVINKVDLVPYLTFDIEKAKDSALKVNHHLHFFETSATTAKGVDALVNYVINTKHMMTSELEGNEKE